MFNYWSAPPVLLRAWACPEEPSPAADGRFHFGSSDETIRMADDKEDSRLSRIGCYLLSQQQLSRQAVRFRLVQAQCLLDRSDCRLWPAG